MRAMRSMLALLLACLLLLGSGPAAAADEATLKRVQARVSRAAGPWCGRAADVGADGIRRCRLRVSVIDDGARPAANALQLAATVGVTRSMLHALDEDELAFMLGHEVAHLALGHGLLKLQGVMRERPFAQADARTVEGLRSIEAVLSSSGPGFHPDTPVEGPLQEFDADALGIVFATRAGYEARAAQRMFERAGESLPGWERATGATHPSPADRAEAARRAAQTLCAGWRESRRLMPAHERLLPQEDYRRDEAATVGLPRVIRCQEPAP